MNKQQIHPWDVNGGIMWALRVMLLHAMLFIPIVVVFTCGAWWCILSIIVVGVWVNYELDRYNKWWQETMEK